MHASLLCFPWGARLVVMLPGELGWGAKETQGDPREGWGGSKRILGHGVCGNVQPKGLLRALLTPRADEDAQGCALLTLSISTTGDPTPCWDLVPGLHRSQWAESFPRGPL